MRIYFTFFSFCLLWSCTTPLKLLEAGEYERAYLASKRQLDLRMRQNRLAKTEELAALQASYIHLQDQRIQQIVDLVQEGAPQRWLRIYPLYRDLLEQRHDVTPYAHLFTDFGYRYEQANLEVLTDNARRQAGAYCFAQAETSFFAARQNEKLAARDAYRWLLRAIEYVPERKEYRQHLVEMRDWGTVRIQMGLADEWSQYPDYFAYAIVPHRLPTKQRDWLEIVFRPTSKRIDYAAHAHPTGLEVSGNLENRTRERFSAEVINGYRTETKEIKQDSVWVTVEEEVPIYTTVHARITTIEQYKSAWGAAQLELVPVAGRRPGQWWNQEEGIDWANVYEKCSGDDRALPHDCEGSCAMYPSDGAMVEEIGEQLRRVMVAQLCQYFPDSQLTRRERKGLGW